MHALIVDDSRFIRDYLRSLLEQHGMTCVEAEDGQQALLAIEQESFAVALVDMNMPVMGGLEFVKIVRSSSHRNDLRILMVTTEADNVFIEAALDAGADEYLMKPFDDAALMDKLQMIGIAGS